jgi:HEPN domain-containing protein
MDSKFDCDKIATHWIETSNNDFNTMLILYNSNSYHWALFLGHIAIEKLLKAYYVKKKEEHAPFTHNLYRLAEMSGIELTEEKIDWLYRITTFNLNARYDDYKKEFYTICTKDFTEEWINKIKLLQQWIKQLL